MAICVRHPDIFTLAWGRNLFVISQFHRPSIVVHIGVTKHIKPMGCSNRGYPTEIHRKLKSCEISFAHKIYRSCPIVLTFCTEDGSDTAMRCVKFQPDWGIDTDVMNERYFVSMILVSGGMPYIATAQGRCYGIQIQRLSNGFLCSHCLMVKIIMVTWCFFSPAVRVRLNHDCTNTFTKTLSVSHSLRFGGHKSNLFFRKQSDRVKVSVIL